MNSRMNNVVVISILCLVAVVVSNEPDVKDGAEKALENAATGNTFGFPSHHYGCRDKVQNCKRRKKQNECKKYPSVGHYYCKKTCGNCKATTPVCQDKYRNCPNWKYHCFFGYYRNFVSHNCPKTCGHCDGDGKWGECSRPCGSGVQTRKCDGMNRCERPCNTHTCGPCGNDVLFIIDQSSSINATETNIIRNFIKLIAEKTIGIPNRHIGVADFSNTFNIRLPLTVFPKTAALKNAFSKVTLANTGAGSALALAMDEGINVLKASANFGEPCNSRPKMVVITDDPSANLASQYMSLVSNQMDLLLVVVTENSNYQSASSSVILIMQANGPDHLVWGTFAGHIDSASNYTAMEL